MKRHDSLIPLSHDHQHALASALRLRRAADLEDEGRRDAVSAFLEFADVRLASHFEEEEELLDRAVRYSHSQRIANERTQLLREHGALRARFGELRAALDLERGPEPELLRDAGQQLTDHIRHEERELFELLQHELDEDALRAITVVDDSDG